MDRTFHRRFTLTSKCFITVVTLLSGYFFWELKPVIGLLLILVVVVMLERVLHTTYTIHAGNDGRQVLTVYRGRFACQTEIPLDSITSVSERRTELGMSRMVLIEYDNGKAAGMQPENQEMFLKELEEGRK